MRAALISIAGQPRDGARDAPLSVAGKTLARRQLDFALAAGCERVIALGEGASAEAIALRHAAEASGARFDAIRDGHGLLGVVGAADELLVLAPGLLPEAPSAIELLGKGNKVLILNAGSGVAAGFERIDLERAWAGALVVPGALVERLAELPADSEPAGALLRVALQARVAERRLPEELLADGSWAMIWADAPSVPHDRGWLKRNLPPAPTLAPSSWLARLVVRSLGLPLLAARQSIASLLAMVVALLGGAVLASGYGWAPLGLGLVALGAFSSEVLAALAHLRNAPFGLRRTGRDLFALMPWLVDAALAACGALAIEGDWPHRLFPPLVLLGTLHLSQAGWAALLRDRALLAAFIAAAAAFDLAEPAVMLAALTLIVLEATKSATRRG